MNSFSKIIIIISILFLFGCASVQKINEAEPIPQKDCNVRVFSSLETAKALGELEELCIISGTSSGSFSHTVSTAISKHKDKACGCGAMNVYIQAQDAGTLGTASVTLVGFRVKNNATSSIKEDKKLFNLAKKCQEKGGVWINNLCQIQLE